MPEIRVFERWTRIKIWTANSGHTDSDCLCHCVQPFLSAVITIQAFGLH